VNRHDPRRNSGFTICDAHIERLASRAPLKTAPAADVPASASIRVPRLSRANSTAPIRTAIDAEHRRQRPPPPPHRGAISADAISVAAWDQAIAAIPEHRDGTKRSSSSKIQSGGERERKRERERLSSNRKLVIRGLLFTDRYRAIAPSSRGRQDRRATLKRSVAAKRKVIVT